jgi:hypothetical protein
MADQDQTPTPIADATGDLSVNDLPTNVESDAAASVDGEMVKGGGINRIVVTDGTITAKP